MYHSLIPRPYTQNLVSFADYAMLIQQLGKDCICKNFWKFSYLLVNLVHQLSLLQPCLLCALFPKPIMEIQLKDTEYFYGNVVSLS